MASGLEILGGVAAAVELTKLMAKFIRNFGTLQNAPRQVKRLDRILDDLRDTQLIENASPKERKRLWDLVTVAEGTLKRSLEQTPNALLQFFWPEEVEKQLKEQNDELQSELITLGLRVDRRRWAQYLRHHPLPGFDNAAVSPAETAATSPPPYSSPESHQLHLPTQTVAGPSSPSSPNPAAESASTPQKLKLPATLYLQSPAGTNVIPALEVKYYQVLERDKETRLIQYERKTEHRRLQVTHRIPRSCLRFEDDKPDDCEVHFLDAHPITLIRSGTGHEVYFLHTKYKFHTVDDRERFLAHMLERKLLGRFYAEEIHYRGQLYARGKVIRLWRKEEETRTGGTRAAIKLTFLARGELQCEWDLDRLSRTVLLSGDSATLIECGLDGCMKDHTATLAIKFRHAEREGDNPKRRKSVAVGDGDADADTRKITWADRVRTLSLSRCSPGKGKTPKSSSSSLEVPSGPAGKEEAEAVEEGSLKSNSVKSTESTDTKSDAERFRDLFQRAHPSSAPELALLPPVAQMPGWGDGEFRL